MKAISKLLCLSLLLGLVPLVAKAADPGKSYKIGDLYFSLYDRAGFKFPEYIYESRIEAQVVSAPETDHYTMTEVVVPETVTIDGTVYDVTSIGIGAFRNNASIKKVKLGQNTQWVDYEAFEGSSLNNIVFPDNEISIEIDAFDDCPDLETLTFNSKTTYIYGGTSNFKVKNVVFLGDGVIFGSSEPVAAPGVRNENAPMNAPQSETDFDYDLSRIEFNDGNFNISNLSWFKGENLNINGNTRLTGYLGLGLSNLKTITLAKRSGTNSDANYDISDMAFWGSRNLRLIVCEDPEPWNVSGKFKLWDENMKKQIKISVPKEAYDAYKNHDVWGEFDIIILAGADDIISDSTTDAAAPAEFYNLNGARVNEPASGTVVIRRQGNTTSKCIVR